MQKALQNSPRRKTGGGWKILTFKFFYQRLFFMLSMSP